MLQYRHGIPRNQQKGERTIKERIRKNRRGATALLTLSAMLICMLFSFGVSAAGGTDSPIARGVTDEISEGGKSGVISYKLPPVSNKSIWAYRQMTTIVYGMPLGEAALEINGITYLPLRAVATALGLNASYSSASRTMTVSGKGLYLTATDGGYVTYANDRPLFSFSPNVIMSNGRMYVPASALTKAVGMTFTVSGGAVTLDGSFRALTPAGSFYREDEVFWLARIITAEAQGESLLGQIAVGDVILNRVRSQSFPNTIYGVIFDRKWGVQFSPVADGTIYNTPTYTATLAAKICLEGTSLSDNAMYFLNPKTAQSSWIVNNRTYAYTIGNHYFFL